MSLRPTPTSPDVVQADLARRVQQLEAVAPPTQIQPTDYYVAAGSQGTDISGYSSDGTGDYQMIPWRIGGPGSGFSPAGMAGLGTGALFNPINGLLGPPDYVTVEPGYYNLRFYIILLTQPTDEFELAFATNEAPLSSVTDVWTPLDTFAAVPHANSEFPITYPYYADTPLGVGLESFYGLLMGTRSWDAGLTATTAGLQIVRHGGFFVSP